MLYYIILCFSEYGHPRFRKKKQPLTIQVNPTVRSDITSSETNPPPNLVLLPLHLAPGFWPTRLWSKRPNTGPGGRRHGRSPFNIKCAERSTALSSSSLMPVTRDRMIYIYSGPGRILAWLGLFGALWGPTGVYVKKSGSPKGPEFDH